MYAYVWVLCMCVYVFMYAYVCADRPEVYARHLNLWLSILFLRWGLSLYLKLTYQARLAGQLAPGICLSLSPGTLTAALAFYSHAACMQVLGIQAQVFILMHALCLLSWALSQPAGHLSGSLSNTMIMFWLPLWTSPCHICFFCTCSIWWSHFTNTWSKYSARPWETRLQNVKILSWVTEILRLNSE